MALFIGGPMDGHHVEVKDDRQYLQVAITKPLKIIDVVVEEIPEDISNVELFTYKREVLSCPTKYYSIFVPQNYDCEDLIDCLVRGYKSKA